MTRSGDSTSGQGPDPLIRTAETLLIERGIGAFSLAAVDQRADVSPGMSRSRYRSHDKLIVAVMEAIAADFHREFQACLRQHPDNPVGAIVEWMTFIAGPARDRTRLAWSLLIDAGTRRQAGMYVEALQVGWERRVAEGLGLAPEHISELWALVEGWMGWIIMQRRPLPDRPLLEAYVRAILSASPPSAPEAG